MKVTVDAKPYWISFEYGTCTGEHYTESEWATCNIYDAVGKESHIVATGTVTRYYLDPPNREVARKEALTKALDMLFPPLIPVGPHRISRREDRQRRRLFWQVYHNRKNKAVAQTT